MNSEIQKNKDNPIIIKNYLNHFSLRKNKNNKVEIEKQQNSYNNK